MAEDDKARMDERMVAWQAEQYARLWARMAELDAYILVYEAEEFLSRVSRG